MKKYILIEIATLFVISLLLAYDFFPALNSILYIPKALLILLFIGMVLFSFFIGQGKEKSTKEIPTRQIVFLVYTLALIIVFTAMGGTSQVGISLDSPALWIVVVISVIQIQRQWKKAAKQDRGDVG